MTTDGEHIPANLDPLELPVGNNSIDEALQSEENAPVTRELLFGEDGKIQLSGDEKESLKYLFGATPSNTNGITKRGRPLKTSRKLSMVPRFQFDEALSQLWPKLRTKKLRKERFALWYTSILEKSLSQGASEEATLGQIEPSAVALASERIEHWQKEGLPRRIYMQAIKEIPEWWRSIVSTSRKRNRAPRDSDGQFIPRFKKKI
jgi:hypothetical protein